MRPGLLAFAARSLAIFCSKQLNHSLVSPLQILIAAASTLRKLRRCLALWTNTQTLP